MTPIPSCPETDVLRRLLLGRVGDPEAAALEEHLAHCPCCQAALPAVKADDHLVRALQEGRDVLAELPPAEAVEGVMQRLRDLPLPGTEAFTHLPRAQREAPSGADDTDPRALLAPPQAPDEIGRLDPYRVVGVLGTGGMGVVFEARDPHLERRVALKVMRASLAGSATARERFLREARAAAALDHEHIVAIFQAGEDRGLLYLAMPLLQGESLEARLQREGRLDVAEVLRIGRETGEGLAAAHALGLVHRDVKPNNIFLAAARPELPVGAGDTIALGGPPARVKILDFGLVRPAAGAGITQYGLIMGTPSYMAPEQGRGEAIDQRADLFSLGCVLYQMCTGELPFRGTDAVSTLLAVAKDSPAAPRELNPALPQALSDLVMQLLAKDPAERIPSAATVVQALRAIERGLPPEGPRPTAARGRRRLAGALLGPLLVALAVAGYRYAPVVVRVLTDRGEVILRTEDADVEVTVRQGGRVIEVLDRKTRQKVGLPSGEYEVALGKGPGDWRLVADRFTLRRGGTAIVQVERVPPAPVAPRRWPADAWRREQIPAHELRGAGGGDASKGPAELVAVFGDSRLRTGHWCTGVAISPDGKRVAAGCEDGTLKVWDSATGEELLTLRGHQGAIFGLTFSADGKLLASGGAKADTAIRVWEAATGRLLSTLTGHPDWVSQLAFNADGKLLASSSRDQTAIVWEVATGRRLHTLSGTSLTFSRDGLTLASVVKGATVTFWDTATGKETGSWARRTNVPFPAFSPDLKTLTTQSPERPGTIELVDVSTGQVCQTLRGHQAPVVVAAFSADGRLLASRDEAAKLKVWDVPTGKELPPLRVEERSLWGPLVFSRDGALLVTEGRERVRLWDLASREERFPSRSHEGVLQGVAFSPDGRELVTGCWDFSLRWWDVATRTERSTVAAHADYVLHLAYSPDGRTLASSSYDGTIRLWGPRPHTLRAGKFLVGFLAWSPDGETLASAGGDGKARLWNAATGDLLQELPGHGGAGTTVSFSPDGRLLAVPAGGGTTTLYRGRPFAAVGTVQGAFAAFSPDGKTLATAGDHVVTLWDTATRREVKHFPGLPTVDHLAFSPDGQWLVEVQIAEQSTVMLWQVGDDSPRLKVLKVPTTVRGIAFSPEGRHLATANGTNTVYVFRLAPPPP
jgi:WD40 repeat protein